MAILYYLVLFLFLFSCAMLCLSILVQESKSSGLGASFGGDAGDSLFGTSTPEILKKISAWLSVIFMTGCIVLSIWTAAMGRSKTTTPIETEVIQK